MDEYSTAHLKATTLNALCSGTYQIPIKGAAPIRLKEPTVIICSNRPIEEVYPNMYQTVKSRFI